MNRNLVKAYASKLSSEWGREVAATEAEGEIVRVMIAVARSLAPSFRYGYHSTSDIEQQGLQFALEVLAGETYDVARPLANFLYVHVHNQLSNDRRKHYLRTERPCRCCDPFCPPAFPCQKFSDWLRRNATKQNIMRPIDMSNVADEKEPSMRDESATFDQSVGNELRSLIDRELAVDLRRDYVKMVEGHSVPKARRQRVRDAVLVIIREKGYVDAEEEG